MDVKPIHTEVEYDAALKQIEPYFDNEPTPGTPEADRFELLAMVIGAYEDKHYPIEAPDPIAAIKFRMEQSGLSPQDLTPMIGNKNRVYEVLAGKRPLTLTMIRRLHAHMGIPAHVLIAEPLADRSFAHA